jgi:hypothetical protein
MEPTSIYDYQTVMKREEQIFTLINTIRNLSIEISQNLYLDKEHLETEDINKCIDEVWIRILQLEEKPNWIAFDNHIKEAISAFVYNFIKHEHDNFVSMGSASTNYWNNLLDARCNLCDLLRKN